MLSQNVSNVVCNYPLMKMPSLLGFWILLLFSYAANGQFRIGLKAGLNLANQAKKVSIPELPTTKLNTKAFVGYQFGILYKSRLSGNLSLAAETNFSVIGSSIPLVATDGETYDTNEKLGYIEVPLTIQYSFNRLYFGAGPSVGFKVFSKLTGLENRTYDISGYKSIDAAGNILAGYDLFKKIALTARYSHGFVNIVKDPGHASIKNRFFNLSVFYYLK